MPPDANMDMIVPTTPAPALSAEGGEVMVVATDTPSESAANLQTQERGPNGRFRTVEKNASEGLDSENAPSEPASEVAVTVGDKPKAAEGTDPAGDKPKSEADRKPGADAAINRLKHQVDQLKSQLEQVTRPQEATPEPRPQFDAYQTPEAYEDALVKWAQEEGERKASKAAAAERSQSEAKARIDAVVKTWNDRVEAFRGDHSDFLEVVGSEDFICTPAMTAAIAKIENGPAVAYHLGQNAEEAGRIAALDPMGAAIEIGALSKSLSTAKPVPKARPPAPIPERGTRTAPAAKDPSNLSMDEYAALNAERTRWNARR